MFEMAIRKKEKAKNKLHMASQYRDNTFEILKARHDNFSFNKAIDTKNKMFKTMHFEGILKHPLQPNMIIYGKKRLVDMNRTAARFAPRMADNQSFAKRVPTRGTATAKMSRLASRTNTSTFHSRHSTLPFNAKNRVQSQQLSKRNYSIWKNAPRLTQGGIVIGDLSNQPMLEDSGIDARTGINLTEDLLSTSQRRDDSLREVRPKKIIPLNLMNTGNIRGKAEGETSSSGARSKNVSRFLEHYQSPYSKRKLHMSTGFRFRTGKVAYGSPDRNEYDDGKYHHVEDEILKEHPEHEEDTITGAGRAASHLSDEEAKQDQPQYIYIIPDGIDLITDKYKVFKQDLRAYVDNMLPNKEEIEKKYPYLSRKEKSK